MPGSEIAFRIADTFTGSLAKLTGEEQKAVKTTAFDLQMNPAHPGMQFHKIDRAKDKNFWSVRVSRDLRLIVHKSGSNLLLCYVDHHDAAYRRSEAELDRAIKGVEDAGYSAVALSKRPGGATGSVAVGTMHLAKGLEFRAVVVAGCDDEVLPLQSRIESVVDEANLEEVYNTERHLLYVACTRARDRLLVTGTDPASEFLDDMLATE